jgi:hypothetical protein
MLPVIVTTLTVAGLIAFTIHEFQEVTSVELDIQMKRLRLQGMQDGHLTTVERQLNDREFREVDSSGKVLVNGNVVPVSRSQ